MSDQLLNAVRKVQKKIRNRRDYYSADEERTTRSLINPILDALGWDTDNPDLVIHQYPVDRSIDNKKVDIVLLRENVPIVIVEAKKLGTRLDNHINQLREYWSRFTTETAILTDGKIWQIYRPYLKRRTFSKRKLFEIDLGEDAGAAKTAARQIEKLTRDGIDQHLELEEWHLFLNEVWDKHENLLLDELEKHLHRFLKKQLKNNTVPVEAVRAILHEKMDVELRTTAQVSRQPISQSCRQRKTEPTPTDTGRAVILAGERFPVKHVYEILTQTAEWLSQRNHMHPKDCPIALQEGAKNYIIHSEPIHGSGRYFKRQKQLSNGLYADVNWKQSNLVRRAHFLLERYGYLPSTLKLIGFDVQPQQTKQELKSEKETDSERIVILEGEQFPVNHINEILVHVAEWLIDKGKLSHNDCPVVVGKQTRYLIHTERKHNNNNFIRGKRLSNGLYLETFQSGSSNHFKRAFQLLEHFGYSPSTLQLIGFDD